MDLSPDTLRQVEFREQWRGYNQDEVDDFLERVAAAVAELHDQLANALARVAQAESRLLEGSPAEDELRRTLVLAQRTAEAARREAEDEAARTLEAARDEAERVVREASERARRIDEDARRTARDEVESLVKARDALAADVDALRRYVDEQRARVRGDIERVLQDLDRPDVLSVPDPPAVAEVDVPAPSPVVEAAAPADAAVDAEPEPDSSGMNGAGSVAGHDVDVDDEALDLDLDHGGEATAAHPAPAAFDEAWDEPEATSDDTGEVPVVDAEALAADAQRETEHVIEHDPFLAELRRAVTDTEPLGPRDEEDAPEAGPDAGIGELYDQDLAPSSRFRLRRRR